MQELDAYYLQLLKVGFLVIRQAIESGENDWINAELEFLHNIPSLVGETNIKRHIYFWQQERVHYEQQINSSTNEFAKSRMRTYYQSTLAEMKPHIDRLVSTSKTNGSA